LCNISGNECIGALVGSVSGISTIENCHVTDCNISGYRVLGGLIGYIDHYSNVTVFNCYTAGIVTGAADVVGGLIGWLSIFSMSTISKNYAFCKVSGSIAIGGLIGFGCNNSIIYNNYACGNVQGNISIGGLVGAFGYGSSAFITDCCAIGNITSTGANSSYIGGLVGLLSEENTTTNCYSNENITVLGTSGTSIGGLAGSNDGSIAYSYATGNIFGIGGTSRVGGLVGYSTGTLKNCVAVNETVEGTLNTNCIVGKVLGGVISNNYAYDGMQITPNGGVAGISTPMATLKSFNFYDTGSNWYYDKPWSIDDKPNSSVIWGICDGKTLPFFQWRGFYCKKSPAKSGNNEEDSLTNENEKSTFSIYPNPAENHITISSEGDFYTVEIVDLFGRIIQSQMNHANSITLDVSNYTAGMYFVRIISKDGESVQKFVKK